MDGKNNFAIDENDDEIYRCSNLSPCIVYGLYEMLAAIKRVMLLSYEGKKRIHDFVVLCVLNCVLCCYYTYYGSLWL